MANTNNPTVAELQAMLAKMQAEITALRESAQSRLSCKVSDKGALSIYGLGRFPVTLYLSQAERLIDFIKSGVVETFIKANRDKFSVKAKTGTVAQ